MEIIKTKIEGAYLLKPSIFKDERGFFLQTYQKKQYKELGILDEFVQNNQSLSKRGVLRGLHLQKEEFSQSKLVSVPFGKVLDVAIDLRKNSKTFSQWIAFELSGENGYQLYIPRGFAHGFLTLSDKAVLSYQCDNYYHKSSELSINPFDPDINIDWGVPPEECLLSEKDSHPSLSLKEYESLI